MIDVLIIITGIIIALLVAHKVMLEIIKEMNK